MLIKGLQKLTLLDFPERLAATVFVGGCNFRCPFCHNASLVIGAGAGEEIVEEEFFEYLSSRVGRLTGVCVSGGEPTLQPGLEDFIRRIKALGFAVKLDTNGYRPEVLRALIDEGLLDYVAMDIKSSKEGYGKCAGLEKIDLSKIEESARLLMSGRVDFEFRTTVVKELHTEEDIRAMGAWLAGDERFYLQTFRDSGDIIGSGYSAHSEERMKKMLEILREYVPRAELR